VARLRDDLLRVFRLAKAEELRRLLGAEAYARAGAWYWRCGLCGRRLRGLRALERHAALKHPREYREAAARALVAAKLRFGRLPRWFLEARAASPAGRG
jgi:hypothetical protein